MEVRIIFLLIYLTSFPAHAAACSCIFPSSIPETIEQRDLIFVGQSKKSSIPWHLGLSKRTKFEVLTNIKNADNDHYVINHGNFLEGCSWHFKDDRPVLIFANEDENDQFVTGRCLMNTRWHSEQFISYKETGVDSTPLNIYCQEAIAAAYGRKFLFGKFEIEDLSYAPKEKCMSVKPYFDFIYGSGPPPNID